MAPRTLKETYSRSKSSAFVESAVVVHGAGIAADLSEKLRAELAEGEDMPDVALLLELMGRRMGRYRQRLLDRSAEHIEELAADTALREMRDEAMKELTRAYITTRYTVSFGYSPKDAEKLGFEVNVATDPEAMRLQVLRLLNNFAKPEVQELRPVVPTVQFVPSEGEATFRPYLDNLTTALAGLNEEKRKADETLLAKKAAVKENDLEFVQISRCIETTFAFAGREDLAERVRPSSRRPGRRQAAEDEDGRGEDGTGSDDGNGGEGENTATDATATTSEDPETTT